MPPDVSPQSAEGQPTRGHSHTRMAATAGPPLDATRGTPSRRSACCQTSHRRRCGMWGMLRGTADDGPRRAEALSVAKLHPSPRKRSSTHPVIDSGSRRDRSQGWRSRMSATAASPAVMVEKPSAIQSLRTLNAGRACCACCTNAAGVDSRLMWQRQCPRMLSPSSCNWLASTRQCGRTWQRDWRAEHGSSTTAFYSGRYVPGCPIAGRGLHVDHGKVPGRRGVLVTQSR